MTHPWFATPSGVPRVLAHRGFVPRDAAGVAENSLAAFAAAHAAGAEYVESDCHLTADGVVVLTHDADLTRVAGDPRTIAAVTHRELEQILAPRGGLVTAADAFHTFPTLRFNLDVKAAAAAAPLGRIIAAHADRVLLTSFSDARRMAALEAARAVGGDPATSAGQAVIARLLTALAARSGWAVRRELRGVDALQLPQRHGPVRIVTPRLLDAAHNAGVEVHVWTVNDRDTMHQLLDAGVDGLVTDHTDLALQVVAERR
ncbi:MAG: glycerophosphodiester phosphodiesterase family protein [Microbacterium sp.]